MAIEPFSKDLTLADAEAIVDGLSLEKADWKSYASRSDAERLAFGIIILQKHLKGKSLRQIEAEMGISLATVQRYKERALQAIVLPTVDAARKEEVDRLDTIITVLWPKVEQGDKEAIASYMKVAERKAKLLGLDKPVQVEATVTELTPAEAELRRLLDDQYKDNNEVIRGELVDEGEKEWPI